MTSVAIAGVGETAYSFASGRSEAELAALAIQAALDDAHVGADEVDGLVRCSADATGPSQIVELLGCPPLAFAADAGTGGAAYVTALAIARAAIVANEAETVVIFRAFNGRSGRRFGRTERGGDAVARGDSPIGGAFSGPYGLNKPVQVFAFWAQAYIAEHGITLERFSAACHEVVSRARRAADANPRALRCGKPLDYAASPVVAAPFRLDDLSVEGDGGCAMVVTTSRRAARSPSPPIEVQSVRQALLPGYEQLFLRGGALPPRPPALLPEMLRVLGLSHDDVRTLGIYDAVSANVLFDLETLGFCSRGSAADWLPDNSLSINPSGGMLGEIYLQGFNNLVATVRELRDCPGGVGVVAGSAAEAVAVLRCLA